VLALVLCLGALAITLLPASDAEVRLTRAVLPGGTFIIPMDDKQTDRIAVYGLVHELLVAGVPVLRVITPPVPSYKTLAFENGVDFQGGPFLVWGGYREAFEAAVAHHPSVAVDQLRNTQIQRNVLIIVEPTKILLVKGWNDFTGSELDFGETEVALDAMGIPYDHVNRRAVEATPNLVLNYDLVVLDCPAWYPADIPTAVVEHLRIFLEGGGTIVLTDRALVHAAQLIPGRLGLGPTRTWTGNATIRDRNGALSQSYGPQYVRVHTADLTGRIITTVAPGAKVLLDTSAYPVGPRGEPGYRIFAAVFEAGNGTVIGFAYHPAEQPGDSFNYTSALYGNVFVHSTSLLLPSIPNPPPVFGAGSALPPPPNPPPPPPPPSLAVPASSSVGSLFAGFAVVGMAEMLRGRIRLPRREKVAVRV